MKKLNLLSLLAVVLLVSACQPELEVPEVGSPAIENPPIKEDGSFNYASIYGGHYVSNVCEEIDDEVDPDLMGSYSRDTLVVRNNFSGLNLALGVGSMEYYEGRELYFNGEYVADGVLECSDVSVENPKNRGFQNPVREVNGWSFDPFYEANGGVNPDAAADSIIEVSPEIVRLFVTDDITGELIKVRYFGVSTIDGSLTEYEYDLGADEFYATGVVYTLEYNSIQEYLDDHVTSLISGNDVLTGTWVEQNCDNGEAMVLRFKETGFRQTFNATFEYNDCSGAITDKVLIHTADIKVIEEVDGTVTLNNRTIHPKKGSNQWYESDYTLISNDTFEIGEVGDSIYTTFERYNP